MAFSRNQINKIRFDDPVTFLTKAQKKYLDKSWAGFFAEKIFPNIHETPYQVLYSPTSGRYNTPINQMVSLLIIKDLTGLSYANLVNEVALDLRYKYALCCTDKVDSPAGASTLSNLRTRIKNYKKKTGIDLYQSTLSDIKPQLDELITKYHFRQI